MERFICIHGHFYQPPRENPWLEAVEIQDSARPYHDWNERVVAECYAPNSASRILDVDGRIVDIVSNYAKISFNFGPTLLSWMEACSPGLYQAILDADRQSIEWRSGHGAAMSQVYNHMIMPLAHPRDKRTQVIWGIRDFEHRFNRFPEGMWLPETAVDLESLDVLAEQGIKFTVLAPRQAARTREIGDDEWQDVGDGIDPTRAYLCRLPSGREITLFFYDGPISQAVAFEKLLVSGEAFADRLMEGFSEDRDWAQLFNIATDGETYGHHSNFGDMALAAALHHIEENNMARLTNYAEYLSLHPATQEVEIHENSSWSCYHGVERWRSNCGCNSGGHGGWNQEWRAPLRAALDWLRDELAVRHEETGGKYLKDPWAARDAYIDVVLDRSEENRERLFREHAVKTLNDKEKIKVFKLLEIQRHAMLMYTSCGWFFDELSGIETVQVIEYAGRALQLAEELHGQGLQEGFLERLQHAKSNIPEHENAATIYRKWVLPAQVGLTKVAIHFAFSSLYKDYEKNTRIYCYDVDVEDYRKLISDQAALAAGSITVTSAVTQESKRLMFCVVRLGPHDFKGGVRSCPDEEMCASVKEELFAELERGAYTDMIVLMDKDFGTHNFSLADLFRDEQREILRLIMTATMEESAQAYRSIYERNRYLMEFVQDIGIPVPRVFVSAAEVALAQAFKEAILETERDPANMARLAEQMKRWNVELDSDAEFFVRRTLEDEMDVFDRNPEDADQLRKICRFVEVVGTVPIEVVLWQVQNVYYKHAKTTYLSMLEKEEKGDEETVDWVQLFRQLGEMLAFNIHVVLPEEEQTERKQAAADAE